MQKYLGEMHRAVATFNSALEASGVTERYISRDRLLTALHASIGYATEHGHHEQAEAMGEVIALIEGGL